MEQKNRDEGYYWVTKSLKRVVLYWNGDYWEYTSVGISVPEEVITDINENKIVE